MKTLLALALIGIAASAVGETRYVNVNNTSPASPYTNWAIAATVIQDAVDAALPGDEIVVTNGVYQTGGRAVVFGLTNRVAITKPVIVRSVNGPEVTVICGHISTNDSLENVRCAYLTNDAVLVGFTLTNGATQGSYRFGYDRAGGGVLCDSTAVVSNCVLIGNVAAQGGGASGGTLYNCTIQNNSAAEGGGAYESIVNKCLLADNSASNSGGGSFGGTLNQCVLARNSASRYGGGGAYFGTLHNCTLVGNRSTEIGGGGAHIAALNNCVLTANSAPPGEWTAGGAAGCILNNCTVAGNFGLGIWSTSRLTQCDTSMPGGCYAGRSTLNNCIVYNNSGGNFSADAVLNYSCTTPLPPNGVGNISNVPLFVAASARNFRLQSNSPCINAGRNADAPTGPDLDGNARIAGGNVDIGAYEFQSPPSSLSYAWLQQYGLPTDGSADFTDPDGDGHNNWQEWRAWTDPTNSASVLRLFTPIADMNGIQVRWQSVSGQNYFLKRSTNIGLEPGFVQVATNLMGGGGTTSYTDTNAIGDGPFFYRVGVQE